MKKTSFCLGLFLLTLSCFARAQPGGPTDITPRSPAQSLSCLQRPAKPPSVPERDRLARTYGMMRVLLRFQKPDEKPLVEVLSNTVGEGMQDAVFQTLAEYRLPCLQPQDGVVSAVQEFSIRNNDIAPIPIEDDGKRGSLCIVRPRKDLQLGMTGRNTAHAVVAMVFDGNGEKAPQVKLLHSSNMGPFDDDILEFAAEYRAPCRTGAEDPWVFQQVFILKPAGVSVYQLKRESFGLMEFLGLTVGAQQLQADFDFNTMNCPFKVNYYAYSPELPNEAFAGGKSDPNRALFLKWLSERQLQFINAKQANDLFGATLQIDVPCGRLKLDPESAAAPPSRPSGG